jgi:outer membrane protein assembly factor BamB
LTSPAGPPALPGATIVCPNCGREVAAQSVICRLCLQPIQGVTEDRGGLAARAEAMRLARRRYRIRRFSLTAATVLIVGWFVWTQWLRPPSALPQPVSTARSMVPATEDPTRWPSEGGDNLLHRATAATVNLEATERWRTTLDARATTPLTVGSRHVYVGVASAGLVALSTEDGREAWRIRVPGQLDAAPTLVGDRLYATLRDGSMVALNAETGDIIWRGGKGPAYFSSPVVADGVVYGIGLGKLSALDAETGEVLWTHPLDNRVTPEVMPAINGGSILAADYRRGELFDRRTGVQVYFYSLPRANHLLLEGNQGVIVGSDRSIGFGLDQRRPWWEGIRTAWVEMWLFGLAPTPPGQPRHWAGPTDPGSYAPALSGDTLVIATEGGLVRGLDMATGAPRWEHEFGPVSDAPIATASGILLAQPNGLLLLDPATGNATAKRDLPGTAIDSASVTSGGLYLVDGETTVIALR